eukprot:CAMPEP_0203977322 /NCGR_PEP_ID=MMETSP0359-20131031/101558_1 /ASSEMBLY_ACC=CAM_ASM_000338 /TAXON_ID=268821 /ORGANISM="Scrippsiella Hangoei, Strain SHTV-5" /LENGTH=136 /DNA_ID=CAMNT_0050915531 /DNA_START=286 /DNA_END=698 /DNA_ORIENTATION=+
MTRKGRDEAGKRPATTKSHDALASSLQDNNRQIPESRRGVQDERHVQTGQLLCRDDQDPVASKMTLSWGKTSMSPMQESLSLVSTIALGSDRSTRNSKHRKSAERTTTCQKSGSDNGLRKTSRRARTRLFTVLVPH